MEYSSPAPFRASRYAEQIAVPLTPAERTFVLTYVRTSNGRQAAIEAGWNAPGAQAAATRLLQTERVRHAVKFEQDRICRNLGLTAQRVVAELVNIATSNISDYLEAVYDESGRYLGRQLNLENASREQMACIQEHSFDSEGRPKIKLYDKKTALDTLAKMFELTPDVVRIIAPDLLPLAVQKASKLIEAEPIDVESAAKEYAAMLDGDAA